MREYIIASPYNLLVTPLIAWCVAQTLKVLIGVLKEKRFNFRWFVGTGGMPSSHAATVSAMTTAVGIRTGVDSVYFAIALLFAVVVLFDACYRRVPPCRILQVAFNLSINIQPQHKAVPFRRLRLGAGQAHDDFSEKRVRCKKGVYVFTAERKKSQPESIFAVAGETVGHARQIVDKDIRLALPGKSPISRSQNGQSAPILPPE